MRLRALTALLCAASAAHAVDRCVAAKAAHSPPRADAVGLVGAGLPAGVLEAAIRLWSDCGEFGVGFPVLTADEAGQRTLRVAYEPGSIGPGLCGRFHGRRIELYRWMQAADGRVLPCGPLELNLAHELGHALGLEDSADPACRRYAMAPIVIDRMNVRRPRSGECAALDSRWLTSSELLELALDRTVEAATAPRAEAVAALVVHPTDGGY